MLGVFINCDFSVVSATKIACDIHQTLSGVYIQCITTNVSRLYDIDNEFLQHLIKRDQQAKEAVT